MAARGNKPLEADRVNQVQTRPRGPVKCYRCAKEGHTMPKCPVDKDKVTCKKCKKHGHLEFACGKLRRPAPRERSASRDSEPKEDRMLTRAKSPVRVNTIDCVDTISKGSSNATPTCIKVFRAEGKRSRRFHCEVLPDTGATRSIVSRRLAEAEGLKLHKTDRTLRAANKQDIPVYGEVHLTLEDDDNTEVPMELLVADIAQECILGWKELQQMGIIGPEFPNKVCQAEEMPADGREGKSTKDDKAKDMARLKM